MAGVPSGEESMTSANDPSEGTEMFPNTDPATILDLHHQKVAQLIREAADDERARRAAGGRNRRFGRWRRNQERGRGGHVAAAA